MENKNTIRAYKIIMLVILTAFITFLGTSLFMYNYLNTKEDKTEKIAENQSFVSSNDSIDETLKKYRSIIDKYYLNEVDENKLKEGAIRGYIDGLEDPYSEYIPAEDMQEYTEEILGNFVGIGVYMIQDKNADRIKILAPIKNTPAEKAGIQPGDYIIKIDGEEYKADDMSKASEHIKGEVGTTVKLEIKRGIETIEYDVKREKIILNTVFSKVLTDNIGYIEITSFNDETSKFFIEEFQKLQEQNIKSLIIDLRNNGGGIVDEAIAIADYIADNGSTLLITKDKNKNEIVTSAKIDPIINMPIVVLVNKYTASASEILAGALKDLNKATIVGTKTFGKGVIQTFMKLPDGNGIKLTSAEYFTPDRKKINENGIEPNEVVELPDTVKNIMQVKEEEDTQLKKAIELLK